MTKDEALRLALEALEPLEFVGKRMDGGNPKIDEAITAIKTALEVKDEPWEQFYPEMGKPKLVEVQDGKCKYCTDGCPACDARKLPEQEPVAWRAKNFYENQEGWFYAEWHPDGLTSQVAELLYTTPPQRTWVGLTDDEQREIAYSDINCWDWGELMDAVEAKLRSKNYD